MQNLMRTKLILPICVLFIAAMGCEKLDLEIDVPRCITKEIIRFSKTTEGCKGAMVYQWQPKPEIEYFEFVPGNCVNDSTIRIYDADCNLICIVSPDKNDPRYCEDINLLLLNKGTLVWSNE